MKIEKYPIGLNGPEINVAFDGKTWVWSYTVFCGGDLMSYDSPCKYNNQITAISEGFAHFSKLSTACVMMSLINSLKKSQSISGKESMKLEKSVDNYILKNF